MKLACSEAALPVGDTLIYRRERLQAEPGGATPFAAVHRDYKQWCELRGRLALAPGSSAMVLQSAAQFRQRNSELEVVDASVIGAAQIEDMRAA